VGWVSAVAKAAVGDFAIFLRLNYYWRDSTKFFVWFFPFWVVMVLMGGYSQFWSCPRCKSVFFYKIFHIFPYNPWAKECRHCGLKKWEEPPVREQVKIPSRTIPDPIFTIRQKRRTFLTLILRDDPGVIGLKRDRDGWVEREDLDAFLIEEEGGFLEIGGFKNLVRHVDRRFIE
jgi:hypothetical protein